MSPQHRRSLPNAFTAGLRRIDPGLAGVALTLLCAAAAFAALVRPLASADEVSHMDYAYQVWHGHLPVFEHGLLWHPPARLPPVQWEAQHPPLFYLILAPFVGPLADGGHWFAAVMVGRAINILITVAALLATAWAASLVVTRNRRAWAITVAAVVAPVIPFFHVGGSVYNDNLAVLLTALTIGAGLLVIRSGLTRGRVIAICVLCALGMLTRAQFGVVLFLASVCVGLAALLTSEGNASTWRRLYRAAWLAALPWVSAGVASGWFYLRNRRLTGSVLGGHPDWSRVHLHRVTRPMSEVINKDWFWRAQVGFLKEAPRDAHVERWLFIAVAVLTGGALVVASVRRRLRVDARQLAIVAVLVTLAAATLANEINYISGGGGLNSRYLLPALLPIGCFIAAGILALPRVLSALAVLGYLALTWGFFWRWTVELHPSGQSLWAGRTPANVPWLFVTLALLGLAAGVLLQVFGVYRARAPHQEAVTEVAEPATEPSLAL